MEISLLGISACLRGCALLRGEVTVLTLKSRPQKAGDGGIYFPLKGLIFFSNKNLKDPVLSPEAFSQSSGFLEKTKGLGGGDG